MSDTLRLSDEDKAFINQAAAELAQILEVSVAERFASRGKVATGAAIMLVAQQLAARCFTACVAPEHTEVAIAHLASCVRRDMTLLRAGVPGGRPN